MSNYVSPASTPPPASHTMGLVLIPTLLMTSIYMLAFSSEAAPSPDAGIHLHFDLNEGPDLNKVGDYNNDREEKAETNRRGRVYLVISNTTVASMS